MKLEGAEEHLKKMPFQIQRGIYRQFYSAYVIAEHQGDAELMDEHTKSLDALQKIFKFTPWTLQQIDRETRENIRFIMRRFFRE